MVKTIEPIYSDKVLDSKLQIDHTICNSDMWQFDL